MAYTQFGMTHVSSTKPKNRAQFAHYKDEMYLHAQRAFGVNPDRHYRLLHASAEDKPKIIVLSAVVIEADGLEAKDANGKPVRSFSHSFPHNRHFTISPPPHFHHFPHFPIQCVNLSIHVSCVNIFSL